MDRLGEPVSVVVVVIAYEAAASIEKLLDRIPSTIGGRATQILLSDDASTDGTAELARGWAAAHPEVDVEIVCRDTNLGYGGNQKACYEWAQERAVDVVVLLHGDEQYPPEVIEDLVAPILDGEADVVHASRMIIKGGARRGGMPIDRFVGNKVLSRTLNLLTGARLTEWFSGFRAYRVGALVDADFKHLPDGFDFDTAVTCRVLENRHRIAEIAIPTRYADEISRVPLLRTGLRGLSHGLRSRFRPTATRQPLPVVEVEEA